MGYAQESGYTPLTIEALMLIVMENVNDQFGTEYTSDTFIGTNWYKYFYALIQRLQESEVKTNEVFLKLQDYITVTNQRISRPVVTNPGLLAALQTAGYIASIKKPIDVDAGKIFVCVDVDEEGEDYAEQKLEICNLINNSTVAGTVSQGTESETIVLTNGQAFDFKFNLPDRLDVLLRLTVTLSENNQVVIAPPDEVKQLLLDNILSRYRLGKNFEPQRYFSVTDAPWASDVLLEYSLNDGMDWSDDVYDANYDDLFDILLENISLVEV